MAWTARYGRGAHVFPGRGNLLLRRYCLRRVGVVVVVQPATRPPTTPAGHRVLGPLTGHVEAPSSASPARVARRTRRGGGASLSPSRLALLCWLQVADAAAVKMLDEMSLPPWEPNTARGGATSGKFCPLKAKIFAGSPQAAKKCLLRGAMAGDALRASPAVRPPRAPKKSPLGASQR